MILDGPSVFYVSFLLNKKEMEDNGVTSHQIIKFSHQDDVTTPTFARLLNVYDQDLTNVICHTLKNERDIVCFKKLVNNWDYQWLVKIVPREDVNEESSELSLLTAQDEAYSVLLQIIKSLKCEVIQEIPIFRFLCSDMPCDWLMKIKKVQGNHVIEIQKATADNCEVDETRAIIERVELKHILFSLQYWDNETLKLKRLHNSNLSPTRKVEIFTCQKCNKSTFQILLALKIRVELFSRIVNSDLMI